MNGFKEQLNKRKTNPQQEKTVKERLSERDLKELMGIYDPKYRRCSGGAYRQR